MDIFWNHTLSHFDRRSQNITPSSSGVPWLFLEYLDPGGGGGGKVPAAHISKTIEHIGMKLDGLAENHKLINLQ